MPGEPLGQLKPADLHGLRLAAQVLRHKAELDGRPRVADYFGRLADYTLVVLAGRGEGALVLTVPPQVGLPDDADREDRRLVAEYFALLVGNERLSPELRAAVRALRARDCR